MALFTGSIGFSLALGAFLVGIIVSESEYSHQIVAEVVPFRDHVHGGLRAVGRLSEDNAIEAEVIDLRSLVPLDEEAIVASVRKTGKALVVTEDKLTGGFGGEVVARIAHLCFEYLDGPVMPFGSKGCPVPFSRIVADEILPGSEDVLASSLKLSHS